MGLVGLGLPERCTVRVLALILSTLIAAALSLAGARLITHYTPRDADGLGYLGIIAISVLSYAPMVLGSITSYWDVRTTEHGRKTFRLWLYPVIGSEVLAGVGIVTYALLAGAPAWLPTLFTGSAIALTPIALTVGHWLLRRERSRPVAQERPSPLSRRDLKRTVLTVAATFVVAFLVLATLGVITSLATGSEASTLVPYALALSFMAAALACTRVTVRLTRIIRRLVDYDMGRARKVGKAVIGKKHVELDTDDSVVAAQAAVVMPAMLGFQLGFVALLYAGLAVQQIVFVSHGVNSGFSTVFLVLLVVVVVGLVPLQLRRIARARAYARDHADLLTIAGRAPFTPGAADDGAQAAE